MTSKEKLDYIISTTPYIDQDVKLANNYAKDIEKDLEVLEMLKTYFKVNGFDELVPNDYWYDLPFEERNKIYKGLENDK